MQLKKIHVLNFNILTLLLFLPAFFTYGQKTDRISMLKGSTKGDTAAISSLNTLSTTSMDSGRFYEAVEFARQAVSLSVGLISRAGKTGKSLKVFTRYAALSYNTLGTNYYRQHMYEDAIKNYKSAYSYAKSSGDKLLIAVTLSNIGILHNEQSQFTIADSCFSEALSLFNYMKDKSGMANSYNNIGNMAIYQSNYSEAARNFLLALKLREALGDMKGIAGCYNNLGNVALYMGNYEEALRHFKISLPIKDSIGDKKGVANLYNAIGSAYGQMNKSEEAIENFRRALEIQKEYGNQANMSQIYNNIGVIYSENRDFELALSNLEESLKINEKLGFKRGIANTLSNIASVFYKKKEYNRALDYYKRSMQLAVETGNKVTERENYKGLSETYAALLDYKMAYHYQSKFNAIKDSLQGSEINSRISEMKTRFESEKKDSEIKLLNSERKLQEAAIIQQRTRSRYLIVAFCFLVAFSVISFFLYNQRRKNAFERKVSAVEMTALRSQMNPHFIFNSLNSIYKYIQLKDPDLASAYLIKFSKLMRLILENSRFQEVSLEKDLHALELYLQLEVMRMSNRFSYQMITDPEIDKEVTLIPPLLLQPFVENAIWHGLQHKDGDGLITIEIKKAGPMLVCVVQDNGIGREKSKAMKSINSNHKGESLGMKITNERIAIINKIKKTNAGIKIFDPTEGVRVEVTIPFELAF